MASSAPSTPQDTDKLVRELLDAEIASFDGRVNWPVWVDEQVALRAILKALTYPNQAPPNAEQLAKELRAVSDAIQMAAERLGCEAAMDHLTTEGAVLRGKMKSIASDLFKVMMIPSEAADTILAYPRAAIGEETLRTALEKCRDKFREYERLHLAKLLPNRASDQFYQQARDAHNAGVRAKALRNADMAEMCEATLSSAPSSIPEDDGKLIEAVRRGLDHAETLSFDVLITPAARDQLIAANDALQSLATRIETLSREIEEFRQACDYYANLYAKRCGDLLKVRAETLEEAIQAAANATFDTRGSAVEAIRSLPTGSTAMSRGEASQ